jgi:hypothetical protein
MKVRAICLLDYDVEGGFKEAAEEEAKLESAIKNLISGNKRVVHYQIEMRERRGNAAPDISKMKFRSN